MDILITIGYLALFIFLIWKLPFFNIPKLDRKWLVLLFVLKFLAGTGLWVIYTFYYDDPAKADIYKFFNDSKIMYDALWTAPEDFFRMLFSVGNDNAHFDGYYRQMNNWYREFESNLYNDSHTMIRFNAVARIFSFGVYHVHTLFMCFVSMIGLTALYKAFDRYFTKHKILLVLAVFLLPSVMLWGSGVLKEGLLFLGLGLVVYHVFNWAHDGIKWMSIPVVILSILLLMHIKFYVGIALLPGLVGFFWVQRTKGKWMWLKYGSIIGVGGLVVLNFHRIFSSFNLLQMLVRKQKDFFGLAESENAGSLIEITRLEPNLWSFVKTAPEAFLNTLTRPHLLEADNLFMLLAAAENAFMILCLFITLWFAKKWKELDKNVLLFALCFVVALFVVVGWTTPVMGSIVRYKIPALPFFFIVLFLVVDRERILRIFQRKKT